MTCPWRRRNSKYYVSLFFDLIRSVFPQSYTCIEPQNSGTTWALYYTIDASFVQRQWPESERFPEKALGTPVIDISPFVYIPGGCYIYSKAHKCRFLFGFSPALVHSMDVESLPDVTYVTRADQEPKLSRHQAFYLRCAILLLITSNYVTAG